jgi:hypothetical protein
MRHLLLTAFLSIGALACGTEEPEPTGNNPPAADEHKATVNGTVQGITFAATLDAAWTRSARESVMVGEKLVGANSCLDMRAAPVVLGIGFNAGLRAGTHTIVSFEKAEQTSGTYASLANNDGNHYATGGSVNVVKDGDRWTGSFDLNFSGQHLTGTFDMKGPALTQSCP